MVLTDMPFAKETHEGARTGDADRKLVDFDSVTAEEAVDYFGLMRQVCERWIVSFVDWRHMLAIQEQAKYDLELIRFGVWCKPNGMPQYSGDRPATGWEAIAFTHKQGKKEWNGGGKPAVFVYNFEQNGRIHPTQKPLGLIKELICLFTKRGDLILDPFAGSFTTMRAAQDLGCRFIGIEREEKYCRYAVDRARQDSLPFNSPARDAETQEATQQKDYVIIS